MYEDRCQTSFNLWGYWSSSGWNGTQLEPTTHCLQDFFNFGKEKFKIFDDNCAALGSSKSNQHCLFDFTSYSNSNDFDIFFLEKELFWYELGPHCTRGFFLSEFLLGLCLDCACAGRCWEESSRQFIGPIIYAMQLKVAYYSFQMDVFKLEHLKQLKVFTKLLLL